jgi:hypothetical protein
MIVAAYRELQHQNPVTPQRSLRNLSLPFGWVPWDRVVTPPSGDERFIANSARAAGRRDQHCTLASTWIRRSEAIGCDRLDPRSDLSAVTAGPCSTALARSSWSHETNGRGRVSRYPPSRSQLPGGDDCRCPLLSKARMALRTLTLTISNQFDMRRGVGRPAVIKAKRFLSPFTQRRWESWRTIIPGHRLATRSKCGYRGP